MPRCWQHEFAPLHLVIIPTDCPPWSNGAAFLSQRLSPAAASLPSPWSNADVTACLPGWGEIKFEPESLHLPAFKDRAKMSECMPV